MFVRSTMIPSYHCFVASPNDLIHDVLLEMEKKQIQAMPVVDNHYFKGMISKQSIYTAFFHSNLDKEQFLLTKKVSEIVSHKDLFITKDEVFEKTLTVFKDFPIFAVADKDRRFLGIITRFDVLEQLESVFGTKKPGIRITFTSEESEGRLERLTDMITQVHANIISITTFDETDKLARRIVLKIDPTENIDKLARKLEKSGFRVLDIKSM